MFLYNAALLKANARTTAPLLVDLVADLGVNLGMNTQTQDGLGFIQVRAVSLAVKDPERAKKFYGETLGLRPLENMDMAFYLGEVIILLKPESEWYGRPSEELNARLTLRVRDSYATEKAMQACGVTVADPVKVYEANPIGSFLDSEGNKLWFCSDATLA